MIVEARVEHAQIVCEVIRDSITRLCVKDHQNNQCILDAWLSNKTPENCETWIKSQASKSFVVIEDETPIGISIIGNNGYIYLCYMHPEKVGLGFGKQLILACENHATLLGLERLKVDSSLTAKKFYEAQGFVRSGDPFVEDNLRSYPLCKQLNS
ncbi:GNAT family N-acetyltransferase [Ketobacter sp. MCCC 1A13808]|uniref:GNAT family N-acetyltransferase n=1 Tax=Ketobacter sp. MCCC 1A13808 TaxID=2602738 RepID=UPI0012EBE2AF|nr:GNAT family N-acetyltransferase [Ketobacter sp. MCCC 1A13808]MVF14975.1 GNAT family N-acetyltransferase [Ketobacter sp. MCCC 1A13808]